MKVYCVTQMLKEGININAMFLNYKLEITVIAILSRRVGQDKSFMENHVC